MGASLRGQLGESQVGRCAEESELPQGGSGRVFFWGGSSWQGSTFWGVVNLVEWEPREGGVVGWKG